MKTQLLLLFFLVIAIANLQAQNVGIGTNAPDASAKLHLLDANRGFLMTKVSLSNITNGTTPVNTPATGLLVWNTNPAVVGGSGIGFYYWDGSIWVKLDANTQNTLDQAYDEGGPGAGRVILATDGAVRINGQDGFIVTGTHNTGDAIEVTGAGTRMFFNPRESAFRTGTVTGSQWNNLGDYSFAGGRDAQATGLGSFAYGDGVTVTGTTGIGIGTNISASGNYSIVIGRNSSSSTTFGTAIGFNNSVTQSYGVALGGRNNTCNASYSIAAGGYTTTNGSSSLTIGQFTTSYSLGEIVTGRFNRSYVPAGGNNSWNSQDKLIIAGNGTGSGAGEHDAMVLYKDGRLEINEAYTFPNVDGSNGEVLTTDGSGTVTWQNVIAGDITAVTAGPGLTGGGTTGAVTLNADANNGLNVDVAADKIQLGGPLVENTTITQSTFNMTYDLNGTGDFKVMDGGNRRLEVNDDGLIISQGTHSVGNTLNISGTGTKMFWYPRKSAFRAGRALGTSWDDANVGNYSTAFNYNNIASGTYSVATNSGTTASGGSSFSTGSNTTASGTSSFSAGTNTTASGGYAMATGLNTVASGFGALTMGATNTASGNYSFAGGTNSTASTSGSIAFGTNANVSGDYSYAFGRDITVSGINSFSGGRNNNVSGGSSAAFGQNNTVAGLYNFVTGINSSSTGSGAMAMGLTTTSDFIAATAIGELNYAHGRASIALGNGTVTSVAGQATVGRYNDTTGHSLLNNNLTGVTPTHPMLVVGNGYSGNRANALVVYQSGNLEINQAYTLPNADGTANQVLTTDGTGTVSWSSAGDNDWNINANGTGLEGAPGGNTASGLHAIAAGTNNQALQDYSAISGGTGNRITPIGSFGPRGAVIAGGQNNIIEADRNAVIGGGVSNFIAGGAGGNAARYSTIAGGNTNRIESGQRATIGGGDDNTIVNGNDATISGGNTNRASSSYATIAGGQNNIASGSGSFVGSGLSNTAQGGYSSVAGGQNNTASGSHAAIAGGLDNTASGSSSVVAGGINNTAYSYGEWVGGLYSTTYAPTSTTAWNANDRLFTLGNGTSTGARSNALTIFKDGRMNINDAYTMPNSDGNAGQVLTTDGAGNASWETRVFNEFAIVFMVNTGDYILDIPWVEITNNGTNGSLTINNTDPTVTLKYSYSVDNGAPISGDLVAGASINITVGFNEADIKLSRYSSITSRFAHFKGLASSGWMKGFITYDQ
ncbi:MAG: hypothetical protein GY810_07610 [Aureispira sp.]|nr:hypothetical protein [Aureispira sp.]